MKKNQNKQNKQNKQSIIEYLTISNVSILTKNTRNAWTVFINGFIVLLGVLSLTLIANGFIGYDANTQYIFILSVISVGLLTTAFNFRKSLPFIIPILIILILYMFLLIFQNSYNILNLFGMIKKSMIDGQEMPIGNGSTTKALLIIIVIMSSFVFSVFIRNRFGLLIITLYSFAIISPVYFSLNFPNPFLFTVFVIFLVGCYFLNIHMFNKNRLNIAKSGEQKEVKTHFGFITRVSAVIICISVVSFSFANYITANNNLNVSTTISSISRNVRGKIIEAMRPKVIVATTLNYGILGDIDEVKYQNIPVFQISMLENKSVYLREWVSNEYLNNSWHNNAQPFKASMYNNTDSSSGVKFQYVDAKAFDANSITNNFYTVLSRDSGNIELFNQSFQRNAITVYPDNYNRDQVIKGENFYVALPTMPNEYPFALSQKVNGSRIDNSMMRFLSTPSEFSTTYYMPNYNAESFANIKIIRDNYNRQAEKIIRDKNESQDIKDSIANEKEYYQYVLQNYLDVPAKISDRTKQLGNSLSGPDVFSTVSNIQKYFYENLIYTLSPGKTPTEKEYVDYFLFERKQGLCSHYATAMTILLRQNNIPARYVEGYHAEYKGKASQHEPNKVFDVLDNDSHAWVEIYIQGVGWIPIEATKYYEIDPSNDPVNMGGNNNQTSDVNPLPSTSKPDDDVNSSVSSGDENPIGLFILKTVLACILLIGLVFSLIYSFYRLILFKRSKRLLQNNNKNSVIALFKYSLFILKRFKVKINKGEKLLDFAHRVDDQLSIGEISFYEVMVIFLKAEFSENDISNDEKDTIYTYLKLLINELIQKSPWYKKGFMIFLKIK